MGTDGMSYSLQSRDLIADSIETVMAASGTTPTSRSPAATRINAGLHHGRWPG